ncbi:hypothetical protein GCM10007424_18320 [Flavobacterium suaedae]|uniref:Uncharacterized protein n=1 Tax=Flavobacterium suaedae TaxID=1767027 RepID=A0ABQ1JW55_9FLAO|nr:hypothetical protein [Flavobacterium suaedae]GGB78515.1 hypothetical protein GCM10007424_18320 [Flavobacterium suaedae]
MKKLFPVFVLLISLTSFAQTKFIEVAVKDTITLQPKTFQCNVFLETNPEEVFSGFVDKEQDDLAKEELAENQLQELKSIRIKKV